MALLLRLRTRTTTPSLTTPSPFHHRLISTSSSGGGDDDDPKSKSPFASYFRDVRDKLKQRPPPSPSNPPSSSNSKMASINEIMDNLSEFRRRTSAAAAPPPQQQQFSFQNLYNKNVLGKSGQSSDSQPAKPGGQHSFDAIRDRLQQLGRDQPSKGGFLGSPRPPKTSFVGGTGELPESVFGREMRARGSGGDFYARPYSQRDLGEKLVALRPEVKGKEWFSIGELNERLMKLREMEMNDDKSNLSSAMMGALSKIDKDEKSKKPSLQRIDMLGLLGGTPDYLLKPPKEHLVEKASMVYIDISRL